MGYVKIVDGHARSPWIRLEFRLPYPAGHWRLRCSRLRQRRDALERAFARMYFRGLLESRIMRVPRRAVHRHPGPTQTNCVRQVARTSSRVPASAPAALKAPRAASRAILPSRFNPSGSGGRTASAGKKPALSHGPAAVAGPPAPPTPGSRAGRASAADKSGRN